MSHLHTIMRPNSGIREEQVGLLAIAPSLRNVQLATSFGNSNRCDTMVRALMLCRLHYLELISTVRSADPTRSSRRP